MGGASVQGKPRMLVLQWRNGEDCRMMVWSKDVSERGDQCLRR